LRSYQCKIQIWGPLAWVHIHHYPLQNYNVHHQCGTSHSESLHLQYSYIIVSCYMQWHKKEVLGINTSFRLIWRSHKLVELLKIEHSSHLKYSNKGLTICRSDVMKQRIQSCKMQIGHEGTTRKWRDNAKGCYPLFFKRVCCEQSFIQSYKNIITTHYIISSKNTKTYRKHDSLFNYLISYFFDFLHSLPPTAGFFTRKYLYFRQESQSLRVYLHYKLIQKYKVFSKINYLDA